MNNLCVQPWHKLFTADMPTAHASQDHFTISCVFLWPNCFSFPHIQYKFSLLPDDVLSCHGATTWRLVATQQEVRHVQQHSCWFTPNIHLYTPYESQWALCVAKQKMRLWDADKAKELALMIANYHFYCTKTVTLPHPNNTFSLV